MSSAAALVDVGSYVSDYYSFLRMADAAKWREDRLGPLGRHISRLDERLGDILANHPHGGDWPPTLRSRLEQLSDVFEDCFSDLSLAPESVKHPGRQLKSRLVAAYESVAAELRAEAVPAPSIRPLNWNRLIFHVGGMSTVLFLLALPLAWSTLVITATTLAAICWSLELLRRRSTKLNLLLMAFFKHLAHPVENMRVNSATWYVTAILILAWIQSPLIAAVAMIVVGMGDPAAGIVGRMLGRTRIVNGKTLEGTVAFFVASFAALCLYLGVFEPTLTLFQTLVLAAIASGTGAVAELLCKPLDDNLTVPIGAALGAGLAGFLLL